MVWTPEISEEAPAAVGLIDADGTLVRATALFLDCCGMDGAFLSAHQEEIERVTSGDREGTTLIAEPGTIDVSAVVTRDGDRQALVRISRPALDVADEPAALLTNEPLDASPAIIWLKDMSGRYLHVNRRYVEELRTDAERVCGKSDEELAPGQSIEGLRLLAGNDRPAEPLEFEYTIAAAEGRPAFAVLRFALRDQDGEPTSVCGVAAPLARADIARAECARLVRLDRWSRGDESAAVSALLEEWGVAAADTAALALPAAAQTVNPVSEGEDQFAAVAAELDAALATSARLESELTEQRRQSVALREASILSARRAHELLRTLSTERAQTEELEEALSRAQADLAELEGERDAERARANAAEAGAAEAMAQERESVENLRLELEGSRAELERLGAMLSAAPTRDELESQRARADEAAVALEQAKAELATSATELANEQRAAQRLRRDLRSAEEVVAKAPTADDLAQERRRADQANAALAEARVRADQSQAEKRSALSQAHGELRRARAEIADAAAALQSERQTVASLSEELAAVHEELEKTQDGAAERPTSEELERERARAERALGEAESALREAREELARSQAEAAALSAAHATQQQTAAELRVELTDAGAELARVRDATETGGGATLDAIEHERTRAERAEAALNEQSAHAAESIAAAELAQREAREAAAVVEVLREEAERLRSALADREHELEDLRAMAQTSAGSASDACEVPEVDQPGRTGPAWGAVSQRALSAGLVEITEWRAALKHVVGILGSEGGWDAAVGWSSDERGRSMKCAAVWTGGVAGLSTFETLTWQHRQQAQRAGGTRGQSHGQSGVRCVSDLDQADDARLRAAAEAGMGTVILVPVDDGNEVAGMLELFSMSVEQPGTELIVSLEGIALQLGAIARQLRSAHTPHWHFGRL